MRISDIGSQGTWLLCFSTKMRALAALLEFGASVTAVQQAKT